MNFGKKDSNHNRFPKSKPKAGMSSSILVEKWSQKAMMGGRKWEGRKGSHNWPSNEQITAPGKRGSIPRRPRDVSKGYPV